jgi:hypothetical protein
MVMKATFTRTKSKPKMPKGIKKVVVADEPDTQVVKLVKEEEEVIEQKEKVAKRTKGADGRYVWSYE